jgi:hypothetical protein
MSKIYNFNEQDIQVAITLLSEMKSKWPLWYTEELIITDNDSIVPDKSIDGF